MDCSAPETRPGYAIGPRRRRLIRSVNVVATRGRVLGDRDRARESRTRPFSARPAIPSLPTPSSSPRRRHGLCVLRFTTSSRPVRVYNMILLRTYRGGRIFRKINNRTTIVFGIFFERYLSLWFFVGFRSYNTKRDSIYPKVHVTYYITSFLFL